MESPAWSPGQTTRRGEESDGPLGLSQVVPGTGAGVGQPLSLGFGAGGLRVRRPTGVPGLFRAEGLGLLLWAWPDTIDRLWGGRALGHVGGRRDQGVYASGGLLGAEGR